MLADVYLSLGSNLGEKFDNLKKAVFFLKKEFGEIQISNFYETKPLDYKNQSEFINCCIFFKTKKNCFEVFEKTRKIEKQLGQFEKELRFGPRIIDIDIIFFSDKIINTPNLKIPHERMHKRAFVLFPLMDLNENFVHPVLKKSVKELSKEKKVLGQGIKNIGNCSRLI